LSLEELEILIEGRARRKADAIAARLLN
jgi:hypothetical protein